MKRRDFLTSTGVVVLGSLAAPSILGCVSNVVEILWRRSPSGLICT